LRLALVSVAATGVAVGLYLATVGTRVGQLVGELILGGRPASAPIVADAEQILSTMSRSSLVVGALTVVGIAAVQRRPRLATAAAITILGANATTQILKVVVLDRTDLLDGVFYPLPNSFPSGHATAAASIAVGAILVLPPLLRAPTVILSSVVVAVVGVSTIAAGWHRMADAVGGVFVATAWGAGAGAVLAWRRGQNVVGTRAAKFGSVTTSVPIMIGVVVLALGGIAYAIAALDPLDVLVVLAERGGSPALFVVGLLLTTGLSVLALGTLGFALREVHLDPPAKRHPPPSTIDDQPPSVAG
jgi:membrane-associated phospholipid phosphatase